jgi:hypothetical protein
MALCSLKYTYVGKKIFYRQTKAVLDQKHSFFPCRSRICDLRTGTQRKFADLRFADWHTSDICGFAIVECAQEFLNLRLGDWDTKKICGFAICGLAHLRHLQICDCRMCPGIFGFAIYGLTKKFACPPLYIV